MEANQPSHTAQLVALSRAAHQLLDHPRVFEDPIAVKIIGTEPAAKIISAPEHYQTLAATVVRAFLVARSCYVETALAAALQRGVRQVVILGAGLDTFPYRNPLPAEVLRVFEVDHPSTQAWKREKLAAAGIAIPASLGFVPLDFKHESLESQLLAAGFKPGGRTFFSWIGVTMYLPTETIWETLKALARLGEPGSEIVFDYTLSPALLPPAEARDFQVRAARVAAAGEPWLSTFEPEPLARELRTLGFTVVEDLGAAELNARFFSQRTDQLRVDSRARLMRVTTNEDPPQKS